MLDRIDKIYRILRLRRMGTCLATDVASLRGRGPVYILVSTDVASLRDGKRLEYGVTGVAYFQDDSRSGCFAIGDSFVAKRNSSRKGRNIGSYRGKACDSSRQGRNVGRSWIC